MRKATAIWLTAAISLVLIGGIVFVGVMAACGWDFTKLSTVTYKTNAHNVTEEFNRIVIKTDTADIAFFPSDDGKCRVECYEQECVEHMVTVQNGTLNIELTDQRSVYEYVEINFDSPKIEVYLPKSEYDSLSINEDTGDIEIPKGFKFKSIDISLSTGDVNLTDVECQNLKSIGNTGDIFLKNVIATENINIVRSTGDVELEGCDAAGISVKTDTGDVSGTLLSEKIFVTKTDTGSISVPKSTSGGKCEITTTTGDIKINISK